MSLIVPPTHPVGRFHFRNFNRYWLTNTGAVFHSLMTTYISLQGSLSPWLTPLSFVHDFQHSALITIFARTLAQGRLLFQIASECLLDFVESFLK